MSEMICGEVERVVVEPFEFGGVVWSPTQRDGGGEFTAVKPGCGYFRIAKYLTEGPSEGRWWWRVEFNRLLDPECRVSVLKLESSSIADEMEGAMLCCLLAKDAFIADIKAVSVALGLNGYATGFEDGKAALSEAVKGVLP